MKIKTALAIATIALGWGCAHAAPSNYSFSATIHSPLAFGNTSMINFFGAGSVVSGSFQYDSAGTYAGRSGLMGYEGGYSVYYPESGGTYGFKNLQGSVAGYHFSDAGGFASINDNQYLNGGDVVSLAADPLLKLGVNALDADNPMRNIHGFEANGFKLVNVRLFWVDETGQMLPSRDLPGLLPTGQGRLALDFIKLSDPNNQAGAIFWNNTVFIDGMTVRVTAVPEPSSMAMLLAGMGLIGAVARRRRQAAQS